MKKIISLFQIIFMFEIAYTQTALSYVPVEIGNVWVSNFYLLDSTGTPIGDPQVIIDSSVAYKNFLGKQTLFLIRRPEMLNTGDTIWVSPGNQSIYIHQNDIQIDTIINLKFPDWFEYYRFGTPIGNFYTIHRIDTTITLPNFGTIPIRFLFRGSRLGNDTLTVPAGFFNAMKFKFELKFQYLIQLPPPLPPIAIDIVTIPIYDWLAQGKYIIKSIQEPVTIDTLNISIPGSMRELVEFRIATLVEHEINNPENFVLYQNYPNPFNGSTVISFTLKKNQEVVFSIHDFLGRKIADLITGELQSGDHTFQFNAEDFNLTSGIYFYTLKCNDFIKSRAMIYLK